MFKGVTDIFFDLDHTLWDFESNSALTFEKIFRENQIDVKLDDFLKIYSPINREFWKLYREDKISQPELRYQRLKKAFDTMEVKVSDKSINKLSEEYILYLSSFTNLMPNTIEVLQYLAPKYNLHIITNGFHEIQSKKLKGSQIHSYFTWVVDSEMAGVKKPDPHIFELALKKSGAKAQNALMVGDDLEADIIGAKALGFQVLHFDIYKDFDHGHSHIIADLIEIKSIL